MKDALIGLWLALNICAGIGPLYYEDPSNMEKGCKGYSIAGIIFTPAWHVTCSFRREEGYGHRFLHELFKTRE